MADGEDTPKVGLLRSAVPAAEGPLAGSGAAPDLPVQRGVPTADGSDPAAGTPGSGAAAQPADSSGPQPAAGADDPPAAKTEDKTGTENKTGTDDKAAAEDKTEPGAGSTAGTGDKAGAADQPSDKAQAPAPATGRRRRIRVPFAHAVRRLPDRRTAVAAARAVRAWSGRPSGRLALPALLVFALVGASGAAGAMLIPATSGKPRPAADTGTPDGEPTGPAAPTLGPTTAPTGVPGLPGAPAVGRPADVFAVWASQTGTRIDVPPIAMQAYGYAEWVLGQTTPGCHLTWTTLAAIGSVESNHGRHDNAVLGQDGVSTPPIFGPPLTGDNGTQRIADTDGGQLDGDRTLDRAIGPMQFIPSTWRESGADADGDGVKNPHDIDDAALAAGNYLCKGNRNLTVAQDWWNAILSYNQVRPYAQKVFDTANRYGTSSGN